MEHFWVVAELREPCAGVPPPAGSPSPAMGAPATQAEVLIVLAVISHLNEQKKQLSALAGGADGTRRCVGALPTIQPRCPTSKGMPSGWRGHRGQPVPLWGGKRDRVPHILT